MIVITDTTARTRHFLLDFQFCGLRGSSSPSQPTSFEPAVSSVCSAVVTPSGEDGCFSTSIFETGGILSAMAIAAEVGFGTCDMSRIGLLEETAISEMSRPDSIHSSRKVTSVQVSYLVCIVPTYGLGVHGNKNELKRTKSVTSTSEAMVAEPSSQLRLQEDIIT